MKESVLRLTKQPSESRVYGVDFSNYAEIYKGGEQLSGIPVVTSTPEGLEISDEELRDEDEDGKDEVVAFRVEGGTEGQQYKITVVVDTNAGNTLEGEGVLSLENL